MVSFFLRSSVERLIKEIICEKHQHEQTAPKKIRKQKEEVKICVAVGTLENLEFGECGKGDNRFKVDDLTKEDSFDFTG